MHERSWDDLLKRLNYRFKSVSLLHEALSHPSILAGKDLRLFKSYQRLEFVGDRVVNLVAAETMFTRFPDANEGELTRYNPLLTSNAALSVAAKELKLGEYLIMGKGEEQNGGRNDNYILACAFEALVGAMFLDSQDYLTVKQFLERVIFSELTLSALSTTAIENFDPKSSLQDLAQSKFQSTPVYRVLSRKGPDLRPVFTIGVFVSGIKLGIATGNSIKEAEKNAAVDILNRTKKLTIKLPSALLKSRDIFQDIQYGSDTRRTR